MRNKRGYYFIVDALIAVMILTVGFMLISSFYIHKPEKVAVKYSADEVINLLSSTKLYELCTLNGDCSDKALEEAFDSIRNKDNTILEVIGELVTTDNKEKASNIIESIIIKNNMVPPGYNLTFFIADNVIYPKEQWDLTREDPVMKKSKALVSSKKVIFGYFEGSIIYWGPYTAEARIWRLEHFIRCKTNADCLGGECDTEYGICTDHLVNAGDFCIFTCNDDRYDCINFECVRKQTDLLQFCVNEAACSAGYYCYKMQCVFTPGDINDPCGYNDDCNAGLICDNGMCSPVYGNSGDDCSATGKCGIGLYCDDGICKYSNPDNPGAGGGVGAGCDSDTDCGQGKICVNGNCEEGTHNKGDDCQSNEECGPGLVCNGATGKCESTSGQQGDSCGSDNDCDIGLICEGDEVKTCQPTTNPGEECDEEEDCGTGLFCNLTLGECVGEECDEQEDCGDGLICDMTLTPPQCVITDDGSGEVCYTDSDCKTGFYCDDFRCTNGQSEAGDFCNIQEDCGVGLICKDGVCAATEGNPCDLCYSFSDCNKFFEDITEPGMTICIDGICYLPDNKDGDCSELGYCQCGPQFFCSDVDDLCHETDGMPGGFCNTDADCKSGLECVDGFCTSTGDVNNTGICGDGIVNFLTEQCEAGMTTTCDSSELNCEGTSIVYCNPPESVGECRWDKSVCINCPVCDFPADCRENCGMAFDEAQALFNFWKSNKDYYCGGKKPEDLLYPTIEMTQCSVKTLYPRDSYPINWDTLPKCSGIS